MVDKHFALLSLKWLLPCRLSLSHMLRERYSDSSEWNLQRQCFFEDVDILQLSKNTLTTQGPALG
jgi:hypothetical protein